MLAKLMDLNVKQPKTVSGYRKEGSPATDLLLWRTFFIARCYSTCGHRQILGVQQIFLKYTDI